MEEMKCKKCGCTDKDSCMNDKVACYWVEPNLCSTCKVYVFTHYQKGFRKGKRVERTEAELRPEEKDILFGELIQKWNNVPKELRNKFLEQLSDTMRRENLNRMNDDLLKKV